MNVIESKPRPTRRARCPAGGFSFVTLIANSNAPFERRGHLSSTRAPRSRAKPKGPATLAHAAAIGLLLLVAAGLAGFQRTLDPRQYGQILPNVPKLEGTDRPYPLPELDEPDEDSKDAEK